MAKKELNKQTFLNQFTSQIGFKEEYFTQMILDIVGDTEGGTTDSYTKTESDAKYETITSHNEDISLKADISTLEALSDNLEALTITVDDLSVTVEDIQGHILTLNDSVSDVNMALNGKANNSDVLKKDGSIWLNDEYTVNPLNIHSLPNVAYVDKRYNERPVLRAFNNTATLSVNTTTQSLNFLTTSNSNPLSTVIVKSATLPTTFTINKTGWFNFLLKVRGTQTGGGTETTCNIRTLVNGVAIGTESRPINDAAINTFSFNIQAFPITNGDVVSFQIFSSGTGTITLSTSGDTIDNMASISIVEYI